MPLFQYNLHGLLLRTSLHHRVVNALSLACQANGGRAAQHFLAEYLLAAYVKQEHGSIFAGCYLQAVGEVSYVQACDSCAVVGYDWIDAAATG